MLFREETIIYGTNANLRKEKLQLLGENVTFKSRNSSDTV